MKITVETIKSCENNNKKMELIFNQFVDYGKKCSVYFADKHSMTLTYCRDYIASGLYDLLLKRIDYLTENNENNFDSDTIIFIAFLSTKKLIKKVLATTNYSSYFKNNNIAYNSDNTIYKLPKYKKSKNQYSEYRNIKKVNSHIIDIVDILAQYENRDSRSEQRHNVYIDNDDTFSMTIKEPYFTPEQELLRKLSYAYSKKYADKIRSDKNYNRILFLKDKHDKNIVLSNTENHFLYDFKKRYNLEVLTSKELFYIVSNY